MNQPTRRRIKRLAQKSEYYRRRAAEKASSMMTWNKRLRLISFILPVAISASLTLALTGNIEIETSQIISIVSGIILTIIQSYLSVFYDPSVFVKLFHASCEFMQTHEDSVKLYSKAKNLTPEQIESDFEKIEHEYVSLKGKYVEYLTNPVGYYWRVGTITIPGKDVKELLPWKTD